MEQQRVITQEDMPQFPILEWNMEKLRFESKWVEVEFKGEILPARLTGDCLFDWWEFEDGSKKGPWEISRWRYYDETV